MVVDDERDIELLFKHEFRKEIKQQSIGFFFAFSAEEAIAFLGSPEAVDLILILSDINMPGMNGIELLKVIKELYQQLRVIMITAYGDDENYNKAMRYGADNFVDKPINFSELRKIIFSLDQS